jgi:hypothetical protein
MPAAQVEPPKEELVRFGVLGDLNRLASDVAVRERGRFAWTIGR